MKVVILCGGVGQRIAVETKNKPKPLIKINEIQFIQYLINYGKRRKNVQVVLGKKKKKTNKRSYRNSREKSKSRC